jgi:hypothetical protein
VTFIPSGADLSGIATAKVINGHVRVTIESMTIGPFPVPPELAASLTQIVDETIADAETKITITEIQVLDGAVCWRRYVPNKWRRWIR